MVKNIFFFKVILKTFLKFQPLYSYKNNILLKLGKSVVKQECTFSNSP